MGLFLLLGGFYALQLLTATALVAWGWWMGTAHAAGDRKALTTRFFTGGTVVLLLLAVMIGGPALMLMGMKVVGD